MQNNEQLIEFTQSIKNQYDIILNKIIDNECFISDELTEKIENITLSFLTEENYKFQAWADYTNKTIAFTKFSMLSKEKTLIHELAHHIWNLSKSYHDFDGHCLEFAIINYCLLRRFSETNQLENTCYFNSYDIHEDKAYSILSINPAKFDGFIRAIEWNNLTDLSNQAKKLARKIRYKSLNKKEN